MADIDERYKRGMIYTIRCYCDDTMIYVGSTINTLSKRFNKHKEECKAGSSISLYKHIENNDWTDFYIELYEYFPCNNKQELNRREGEVIREIGTINKNIAGRTHKEWCKDNIENIKEYKKEWYKDNADKIKEYYEDNAEKIKEKAKEYRKNNVEKINERHKKYYENNTDKINERYKKYYENNAEKIKERHKKYYENNVEKIKEYQKEYYKEKVCCNICGAFSTKNHLVRHQKTKKCISKIPDNTDTHTDT